jgi:hypothetical protein
LNNGISKTFRDSADITLITQLILRERTSRYLGDWDRMRDCFHPDSIVRISWFHGSSPYFVKGSIDMAKRGMLAKHRLGPILVDLHGDRAVASLTGIIDIPMVIDGVDLVLSAYGRFLYRVERRDQAWWIYGFDCIYQRDELTPVILGTTVKIDPEKAKNYRPSYRNLCYCLSLTGYTPNPDLPGEDRPETAQKLMAEINAWTRRAG